MMLVFAYVLYLSCAKDIEFNLYPHSIRHLTHTQGGGQVQLTKYSSTSSTTNIYQVQVLVKYSFF